MPTVKQVAVYNGSQWSEFHDIGAKATNVTLSDNSDPLLESTNVQGILKNLIGANRNKLTGGEIVTTTASGSLTTSGINTSALNNLNNVIIPDNTSIPVTGETSEIKKLKQGSTIIYPTSKTSAIYMSDNETTLDGYLGNTNISGSGKSTISGIIGNTDISGIADGTITGALKSLNNFNYKYMHLANSNNTMNWYIKKYSNGRIEGHGIWNLGQYTFNQSIPNTNNIYRGGTVSLNEQYNFSGLNMISTDINEAQKNIKLTPGTKYNFQFFGSQYSNNIFAYTYNNTFYLVKPGITGTLKVAGNNYIYIKILEGNWISTN